MFCFRQALKVWPTYEESSEGEEDEGREQPRRFEAMGRIPEVFAEGEYSSHDGYVLLTILLRFHGPDDGN